MSSQHFIKLMDECREIHDRKNSDYAADSNPFSNFDFSASLVKEFNNPVDQVFAGIIGIKIARLGQLRSGKVPKNESIRDTHLDLVNYAALWGAYWDNEASKEVSQAPSNTAHEFNRLIMNDIAPPDKTEGAAQPPPLGTVQPVEKAGSVLNREQVYLVCPKCRKICHDQAEWLKHAYVMHSAILNRMNGTVLFGDGSVYTLNG